MRTSHTSIRKRIAEERLKLTDKQFFTSAQFAAYLTDLLEAATKRYKRNCRVFTYWDDSANVHTANTDNRVVNINAGNRLTRSFPTRSLRADSLIGLVGHEAGHMIFSDFTMLSLYHMSLSGGRFYPAEPKALSLNQESNLEQIKKCFNDKDTATIHALSLISHNLVNIMEDVYIETRMCDAFPGSFKTGIYLNNLRFAEDMLSIQDEIDRSDHEISIVVNLLIQYAKTGNINNLSAYQGPYLDALYECIPFVDDASYADDPRERFEAANMLLLILWPFMESLIHKIREDENDGTSHADEELKNQIATLVPLPQGTDFEDQESEHQAVSGTGVTQEDDNPLTIGPHNHGNGRDEDALQQLQKAVNYETGRIALEKTEEIGESNDGGISRNPNYSGTGYVSQAESDMQEILTALAEEQTYIKYEQELSDELQHEADTIRYGNAHKGIHVTVNRMSYVDDCFMTSYQKVAPPLLLISRRLQKQISQLLRDYRMGGKLDNLPIGKRISVRNAIRQDGKLFYTLKLPNDQLGIAVAVINDESGSMSSNQRITYARSASIILHDFCNALNIPIAIYGHTEDHEVELYAYAEFDSIDNKDRYRLMDMSSRSGNRDGAAIRYVAERLLQRPEEIKLLFIISDGQPAAENYYGTEAEADLRGIKQEYRRKGIKIFAAAIGDDKPNIQRIYGEGFLDITNLDKLPVNLSRLIIQHVKNQIVT